MIIEPYFAQRSDLEKDIKEVIVGEFGVHSSSVDDLFEQHLLGHINRLKEDIFTVIEPRYVDKVYRDSYYSYFSSKYDQCRRDCIRLCFFLKEVTSDLFQRADAIPFLQENFVGFMVLRPTIPNIVGRSVISSKGLRLNGFCHCMAPFDVTVCGVKLTVEGFPHSSQDSETLTCAETTVWSTMEYFGTKYPEYTPILPSKIVEVLKNISIERQVPSQGLTVEQISFAIKKFGFGAKLYSKDVYGVDFKRLLNTYVESGVPVIVSVENYHHGGDIGHAILCVGHQKVEQAEVDKLAAKEIFDIEIKMRLKERNISCFDYGDVDMDYIFIDDNCPVYQNARLDAPVLHYEKEEWHDCEIMNFIVPLYPKIYLEAYEARNFIYQILAYEDKDIQIVPNDSDVYVKIFLTSSRSYKNEISKNDSLGKIAKNSILQTPMPKFVWVAELGEREMVKEDEVNGIIILDATEANLNDVNPLILALCNNNYIPSVKEFGFFKKYSLDLQQFRNYRNNLKSV